MLSWLSQAVRVGAQCELKTIKAGVEAAMGKQEDIEDDGGDLVEGSVLVLVEPGVYEEGLEVDDGQRVSIWRCDRESESDKKEMAKVEWRSRDEEVLAMPSASTVSVNGMHMSAVKSEGYDGDGFNCVDAHAGATLSLELCDLTCECDDYAVVEISNSGTAATISDCCIHDGESGGVHITDGASATLENNNIHSNTQQGVTVQDEGSKAVLRGNRIHDGKESGVVIFEGASSTFENNNIYSNTLQGVGVQGKGSEVVMRGNHIHDGKGEGMFICDGASATLENNTITDNDLAGVDIDDYSTATLTGNTIKGNGQCKIERTEEELAGLLEDDIALYRSSNGFPGVRAAEHSTVTMPLDSNAIEGNGKVGSSGEQMMVDDTSKVN
jgi:parallel beta-helix repeat protein